MFSSCAMKINGVYIEDLIDGYTTLNVEGRDALEMTEETEDIGNKPGSILKRKKYSARTLTINFAIEGFDTTEIRTKGRELQYTLDTENEECEIIFDDENDVFYKGTPVGGVSLNIVSMHGTGNAIGSGSFNILCSDPFKYSVEEFVVESNGEVYVDTEDGPDEDKMDEFVIDYNGTYPAYPTFIANMYNAGPYGKRTGWYVNSSGMGLKNSTKTLIDEMGSCGFLALVKNNGNDDPKVIQFGDPDFERFTEVGSSRKLVKQYFQQSTSWDKHSSKWDNYDDLYGRIQLGSSGTFSFYRDAESSFAGSVKSSVKQNRISLKGWTYSKTLKKYVFRLHSDFSDSVTEKEKNKTVKNTYFKFYNIFVTAMERTSATNLKLTMTASAICKKKISGKEARTISLHISFDGGSNYKEVVMFKNKKEISKNAKNTENFHINVSLSDAETCSIPANNIKIKATSTSGSAGNVKATSGNKLLFNTYQYHSDSGYYLTCNGYGTQQYAGFHGPVLFRNIPIDPMDDECKQWYFTTKPLFSIGSIKDSNAANKKRKGALLVGVADDDNVLMGYYIFVKTTNNSKKAKVYYGHHSSITTYLGEVDVSGTGFNQEIIIKKMKDDIDFKLTSKLNPKPIKMHASNRGKKASNATKIVVGIFQYKTEPVMFKNGIEFVTFKKYRTNDSGDDLIEIGNEPPFKGGDTLEVETSTCEVRLNGRESAELGALGNDWDGMCLERGLNIFGAYASNFFTTEEITSGKANAVMKQCTSDDAYRPFLIRCSRKTFVPCYDAETDTFAEFDLINNPLYIKSNNNEGYQDDESGEYFHVVSNIRDYETYTSYPYEYFYNMVETVVPYDPDRKYFIGSNLVPVPENVDEYDSTYRDSVVASETTLTSENYYEIHADELYYRSTNPLDLYYKSVASFTENETLADYRTLYEETGNVYADAPAWSSVKKYKSGTKVSSNNLIYKCIRYGSTTINPVSSGLWRKASVGYIRDKLIKNIASYIGNKFVSKKTWTKDEICTHKGVPYIAVKSFNKSNEVPSGQSNIPGVGKYSAYWRKLNTNSLSDINLIYLSKNTEVKNWSGTKIYCNYDLCIYNNTTYILKGLTYTFEVPVTNTKYWKLLGESSSTYRNGEDFYYDNIDDLYSEFNNSVLSNTEYYSDLKVYTTSNGKTFFNCGDLYSLSGKTHGAYNPAKVYCDEPEMVFKTAYPSKRPYTLNPENYYILDVEKPEFKIKYREVFI